MTRTAPNMFDHEADVTSSGLAAAPSRAGSEARADLQARAPRGSMLAAVTVTVAVSLALVACSSTGSSAAPASGAKSSSARGASADCVSDDAITAFTRRFAAKEPQPAQPDSLTMTQALCGRDKFVNALVPQYGRVIGYKAGLTNAAAQKRFNYDQPLRGALLEKMIVRGGSTVPASFGARPVFEADMVVSVRDDGINDASTPAEVIRHISGVYPFIELPDLVFQDPAKDVTGPSLTLANVGARLGVLGEPIPVNDGASVSNGVLLKALEDVRVGLVDGKGTEFDAGTGTAILGHPLNAVVWLVRDLKKSGITLKKGDLLSLGTFTKLHPAKPGMDVTAVYQGLPGNPRVSVSFR